MSVISIPRVWSKEQKDEALDQITAAKYGPELKLEVWQREATRHRSTYMRLHGQTKQSLSSLLLRCCRKVKSFESIQVSAVALNADTESAATQDGRNLWHECAEGRYRVILCSPEQLASPKMSKLLEQASFRRRVRLVVVDEVHLIPIWGGKVDGRSFRRAFMAIGSLRSRLDSSRTVCFALSATLMPGKPTAIVESSLGLQGPNYHRNKLNCVRTNLHLALRRIHSSFTSGAFDDLDWLLQEVLDPKSVDKQPNIIPKTIIYIDNIPRGWDLVQYLRKRLPPALLSCGDEIIRHIHSATCPQCKQEILDEFSRPGDTRLRIVVATDVFGCGINIPDVVRVVNYGTPRDFPTGYQRAGRAGRKIPIGWGCIYVNPMLWDEIAAELGIQDRSRAKRVWRPKISSTEGSSTDASPTQSTTYTRPSLRVRQDSNLADIAADALKMLCQIQLVKMHQRRHANGILSIPTDYSRIFNGPDDFLPESTVTSIAKYLRDMDGPCQEISCAFERCSWRKLRK